MLVVHVDITSERKVSSPQWNTYKLHALIEITYFQRTINGQLIRNIWVGEWGLMGIMTGSFAGDQQSSHWWNIKLLTRLIFKRVSREPGDKRPPWSIHLYLTAWGRRPKKLPKYLESLRCPAQSLDWTKLYRVCDYCWHFDSWEGGTCPTNILP